MAVKIIKEGSLPEEKEHRVTCSNCITIFSFQTKDAKLVLDQREGSYLQINCPFCKKLCSFSHNVYNGPVYR